MDYPWMIHVWFIPLSTQTHFESDMVYSFSTKYVVYSTFEKQPTWMGDIGDEKDGWMSTDYLWISMDYPWISMDYSWIIHGLSMDYP